MVSRRALGLSGLVTALALLSVDAHAIRPRGPSQLRARAARGGLAHQMRSPQAGDATRVQALRAELGEVWVSFELADDRPARILTATPVGDAVVEDGALAEADARARLHRLLPQLAPELALTDLRLVANHYDPIAGVRSVAFAQAHQGLPVEGGQLSFRYAHGRLVAIANDTLPLALVPRSSSAPVVVRPLAASQAIDAARRAAPIGDDAIVESVEGPMWRVGDRFAKRPARRVHRVTLRSSIRDARVHAYVDELDPTRVELLDGLRWGQSPVRYRVPRRYPAQGRYPYPAAYAEVTAGGSAQQTGADGWVAYPGTTAAYAHALEGPYALVTDISGDAGPVVGTLQDAQVLEIDPGSDELADARLTAFVHTNVVTRRLQAIAPGFEFGSAQLPVNVNIDDVCNAFWDGQSVNFFLGGGGCENTGRLPDVVYHEFGHGAHQNAIIEGVGLMNVALSEGVSDYLSATITGDSGLARGFFAGSDEPLRQLDPVDFEWTWPDDIGEVHDEGRIIGGALWDLREALIDKYGAEGGVTQTDRLWFAILQRAYDIPSAYFEVLVADDDDGNLFNGTPNVCEISEAFGAHGLFRAPGQVDAPRWTQLEERVQVELPRILPFPQCDIDVRAELIWRVRGEPDSEQRVEMETLEDRWSVSAPKPPDGTVIEYAVELDWSNGTLERMPGNLAQRWFEAYVGPVVPLYCTSFEDGGNDGWTPFPPFEIGVPTAASNSGDPTSAHSGELIAGINLDGDGKYSPVVEQRLLSPPIDIGPFSQVRLQYWRDLDVEDGYFDQASVIANGQQVWRNFGSPSDITATVHHRDAGWVFHDVDLSDAITPGAPLELEFALQADGGLEFGGWQLDSLCVVGVAGGVCGDGRRDPGEACDDGNREDGDGCDAQCRVEPEDPQEPEDPGAGETSGGETGGDGGSFDGISGRGCACDAKGDGGPWGALALVALLGLRRRRESGACRSS